MTSFVDLTGRVTDLGAVGFDLRRTKVWVEASVEFVVDEDNNVTRLGPTSAQVAEDGSFVFTDLIATNSTGVNPTGFQYRLWVDYAKAGGNRERVRREFGWFSLTADTDLSDIVAEQYAPPNFQSTFMDQAQAYLDAQASLAGIDTSDQLVETLVRNTNGLGPLTSDAVADVAAIAAAAAAAGVVDAAPGTLDTLNELAAALGDDPNYAATVTTALAGKAAKSANLSDLANVTTARTNLGLGTAATVNTGTTSGTVPVLGTGGRLAIARLASGTPDGTKFVRDDGTLAAPDVSGGGGGTLAYLARTAATDANYSINSSTNTDVDATNLAITFTVPASGTVDVTLAGYYFIPAGLTGWWSLRSGSSNVAGSERRIAETSFAGHQTVTIRVTGLTPTASVTYKWAWRNSGGGTTLLRYGGTEFTSSQSHGPMTMTVRAA